MADDLTVVIMAAGQGTRMRSSLPKVLHPVCGRPMVEWVIGAARDAGASRVVCVTRPGDGVAKALPGTAEAIEQTEGEGTGSAILAARGAIEPGATVVILSGDVPLTSAALIRELVDDHAREGAAATLLTTEELDPTAYGRVMRDANGDVERIVETKRTEGVEQEVLDNREINIGTYAFDGGALIEALDQVGETDGERYLTGVFPILIEKGLKVAAHRTADTRSAMGVNTRADLMEVTSRAQRQILRAHAERGVTFTAPDSVAVDAGIEIGEDTTIGAGVTLRGATRIGARASVGPATTIIDSTLGDEVTLSHSVLDQARVAEGATIGPFAYLRPEADIGAGAKVGTFVEIKKSTVGAGAKVPHLSYIGDADVGEGANVGGGAITANYHAGRKTRTTIGKDARTGVHNSFVAPVRVGDAAYTGAGSVITDDVPDGALGIAREKQTNVEGYAERMMKEQPE
jgi:bifunctional UDP-N-acetylglucosamine pyrophosphorylase/glucosamine-1-phosphate N-acetyltransferase